MKAAADLELKCMLADAGTACSWRESLYNRMLGLGVFGLSVSE